jgi:copper chaperone for superoxide dismutase
MVQVSPSLTLIDLKIRGLPHGKYWATVRETGDISQGAISTGGLWKDDIEGQLHPKGGLGPVDVGMNGMGNVFFETPFQIWEIIGRAMVLSMQDGDSKLENNDDILVGVIARSAGMWDNDKTVCSCSGKTLWQERNDEVMKGML